MSEYVLAATPESATAAACCEECPVCLDALERAIWCTLPCAHRMCFRCLVRMTEHAQNACPLCRHDLRDCVPTTPRVRMRPSITRSVDDDTAASVTDEIFDSIVRRIQVASVVEHALRTQSIAPRNATPRLPPSLDGERVV